MAAFCAAPSSERVSECFCDGGPEVGHIFLYSIFELFLCVLAHLKSHGIFDRGPFCHKAGLSGVKGFLHIGNAGGVWIGVELGDHFFCSRVTWR